MDKELKVKIDTLMKKYNIPYSTQRERTRFGWNVIIPLEGSNFYGIHIEDDSGIETLKIYLEENNQNTEPSQE